jgi:hypothetical protein
MLLVSGVFGASQLNPTFLGTVDWRSASPPAYGGTVDLGMIVKQTIASAESSDDDQWCALVPINGTTNALVNSTGRGSSYFAAQPDVPRNMIITLSQSATVAIKFTGTDIAGSAITENVTITAGTTGASTKAFKTVTRVDTYKSAGTDGTMKVGTGNLLGLCEYLAANTLIPGMTTVNGVREGTEPSVTTSSTVLSLNTADTNSAPGGYNTVVYMAVF